MWRPDPAGPQGPMQVSEKAAIDVAGGNRFDVAQNRTIGRASLALLFDVIELGLISAYNWGLGHLDNWIRAGRAPEKLVPGVSKYLHRVMQDSGICHDSTQARAGCEVSGSSTAAGLYRFNALPLCLEFSRRLWALAARFGAEQTRLAGTLARNQ